MNVKIEESMIPQVISIVVAVIVACAVLIPVTTTTQATVNPTTVENEIPPGVNYKYAVWNGEDITFKMENSASTPIYTVNGVELNLPSTEQRIIIASNDFACRTAGANLPVVLNSFYVDLTYQEVARDFTFSVVNGEYTLNIHDNTYTGICEWIVYATPGEATVDLYRLPADSTTFYTSNEDDMIVLGNIYNGTNATFYSYFDGELTVNPTYADNSSVTITKTLVEGYTDIYDTAISVNIDGESFTPQPTFILIPHIVHGHEAGGIMFTLLGVIPVFVVLGILLGIVGIFYVNGRKFE